MVRYPHTIDAAWKSAPTKDSNGDFVEGASVLFSSPCRAEANGEGKTITGQDGSTVVFSFEVFLPKTSIIVPFGASVEITISAGAVVKGTIKNHDNGQLISRLWV